MMRARNLYRLCPFLLILITVGCATIQPAKTLNQIILNDNYYTSDRGRYLVGKYRANLEKIVSEIRGHYLHTQLEFVNPTEGRNAQGIYFGYQKNDPEKKTYLTIHMYSTTQYNTLQTDYSQRAASVFLQFGRTLFDIAYGNKDLMLDNHVYGVCVTLQWIAKDFLREKYFGGKTEGISVWTTKSVCSDFIENKITNQEFLRESKVFGSQGNVFLGLVEIDLGRGL